MPHGKACAQAGHAFCATLAEAIAAGWLAAPDARQTAITRIVLIARDADALLYTEARARAAGLPCALFTDKDHVCPPDFDGRPVLTALGVGPCRREAARPLMRRYKCLR